MILRRAWIFYAFHDICEKLLTKLKIFEIRKIVFRSLFIWKIFEMRFQIYITLVFGLNVG